MKTKKKNRVWISARISPESYKILVRKAKRLGSKGLAIDEIIEDAESPIANYYQP